MVHDGVVAYVCYDMGVIKRAWGTAVDGDWISAAGLYIIVDLAWI